MAIRDFTANVISASKVVPDGNFKTSAASGVWDINEALDLIKGGNWPNAANIDPAAFVDGLFQTHLYVGTAQAKTINNGIDLTKGGLVWIKRRDGNDFALQDTERGATKFVRSNTQGAESTDSTGVTSFNNNGFSLGISSGDLHNKNNVDHVAWTFRKQPKFFDVQSWTGNGSTRTISHDLGSVPGTIIIKRLDDTAPWVVYHRSLNAGNTPEQYYIYLHDAAAEAGSSPYMNNTAPTSTEFTLTSDGHVNGNTNTYVAYLFAHNNNDGGFGSEGDQDIIKCDTYTGNGSATGPLIDLGFEPQFLIIKRISGSEDWMLFDSERGVLTGGVGNDLRANDGSAENSSINFIDFNSNGFQPQSTNAHTNSNNDEYIYIAIRRGGMQTPTAGTDVLSIKNYVATTSSAEVTHDINFDLEMNANRDAVTSKFLIVDKLRGLNGQSIATETNAAENDYPTYWNRKETFTMHAPSAYDAYWASSSGNNNHISYGLRRANKFFDQVCYDGTGSNRTVSHNLNAVPEMIWIKKRDGAVNWVVYHSGADASSPENYYLTLNSNASRASATNRFNDTAPTSSVFTVGTASGVNSSGAEYVAYLFATVAGVSKVGSWTMSSGNNDIDCGFTSGARLVLIKDASATEHWLIWDSVRGIVAGNDPYLEFDDTVAEYTTYDFIDPLSSGFTITSAYANFYAGNTYIFWAVA